MKLNGGLIYFRCHQVIYIRVDLTKLDELEECEERGAASRAASRGTESLLRVTFVS